MVRRRAKRERSPGAALGESAPTTPHLSLVRGASPSAGGTTEENDGFSLPPQMNSCISLNVGGTVFSASVSTLLSEPSRLRRDAESGFACVPRDKDGRPYYDRDPQVFRHVLNYLRGYPLPLTPEECAMVAEDAAFFEMNGLKGQSGFNGDDVSWRFQPGPGVSLPGDSFDAGGLMSYIGPGPLLPGVEATVYFRFEKLTSAVVGVAPLGLSPQATFFEHANTISYESLGDISCFIGVKSPHEAAQSPSSIVPTRVTVPRIREGDEVRVTAELALNERSIRVRFFKQGQLIHDVRAGDCDVHASPAGREPNTALGPLQLAVFIRSGTTVGLGDASSARHRLPVDDRGQVGVPSPENVQALSPLTLAQSIPANEPSDSPPDAFIVASRIARGRSRNAGPPNTRGTQPEGPA